MNILIVNKKRISVISPKCLNLLKSSFIKIFGSSKKMDSNLTESWHKEVNEVARYGPIPPPIIVRSDEAGDPNDPLSPPPIIWERRAAPYDIEDIEDTANRTGDDYGANIGPGISIEIDYSRYLPSLKMPLILKDIVTWNGPKIDSWIYTYSLRHPKSEDTDKIGADINKVDTDKISRVGIWPTQYGLYYISKIAQEDVEYPSSVRMIVYRAINNLDNQEDKGDEDNLNKVLQFSKWSNSLQLYIPRNKRNSDSIVKFFLSSIYWLRYVRPTRKNLPAQLFSPEFTPIDLYLITANPTEHYAARTFLSYHNDIELLEKFGRIGNYLFPRSYENKRDQLDALVAFSLFRFGYFTVDSWVRPIQIKFNLPMVPIPKNIMNKDIKTWNFQLNDLLARISVTSSSLFWTLPNNKDWSILPILRLGIQVHASWPFLKDKDAWQPLIELLDKYAFYFRQQFLEYKKMPYQLESDRNVFTQEYAQIPEGFTSLEQIFSTCLLCQNTRPQEDFGLCGHGVCIQCQALLGSVKCPFCTEHFTADNINAEFIYNLARVTTENKRLSARILEIFNKKRDRAFRFDWCSSSIRVFH